MGEVGQKGEKGNLGLVTSKIYCIVCMYIERLHGMHNTFILL